MHLGIDFGTTRTVVAGCDRGNYPVVGFVDAAGDTHDFYPSVVSELAGVLHFGPDALRAASDPRASVLRSFKRLLSGQGAAAERDVEIGSVTLPVGELLTRFAASLREAILMKSNLRSDPDPPMVAVVATPANAHGTQRFLTLDAFRRAGFEVVAMLNEPSAAGFEYTHRHRNTLTRNREHIVVYDLGGGTFDASLVRMTGGHHDAILTAGLGRLGGDDFDDALARLALEAAGRALGDLSARALGELRESCRQAKEALNPNSRRITVDVDEVGEVTVPVSAFYDACTPLIERTIDAMAPVISRLDSGCRTPPGGVDEGAPRGDIAGIYVVGGGSCLPAVGRLLRERFGRRVHRSPYPFAATAIGLAIAADVRASRVSPDGGSAEGGGANGDGHPLELEDRFSRTFGVFREAQSGLEIAFDPIFTRETRVPVAGSAEEVARRRIYRAAHNVGHFRMIECADLDDSGSPQGEITPVGDVLFPFDASLRERQDDLGSVPVQRTGLEGPLIQEQYSVDAYGIVELRITDLDTGFERSYRVGGVRA